MPGAAAKVESEFTLEQLRRALGERKCLMEDVIKLQNERLEKLDDYDLVIDNKLDILISNMNGFEKKIISEFNNLRLDFRGDINSLSKDFEISKRENSLQHDSLAKVLGDVTVKLSAMDGTLSAHEKRIRDLEKDLETLRTTCGSSIKDLKDSLDKLEAVMDKETVDFIHKIKKEYETNKNLKATVIAIVVGLGLTIGGLVYFQDIVTKMGSFFEFLAKDAVKAKIAEQKKEEEKKDKK